MSASQRERLARLIDRGRRDLANAVRAPEDLSSAETIALSRRLDTLIFLYLRLTVPPGRPR